MRATLEQYRDPINRGEINPHLRYDGRRSGTLLDPADPQVPLQVLSFAVYQLAASPWEWETGPRENVLVLQGGSCTVTVDGTTWQIERPDGPFAADGGPSPGNAVYVPREAQCTVVGEGELAVFAAPASERRPAACVASTDHPWVTAGPPSGGAT
jgi:5-deoxy-D-glucuronate isomerase